VYLFNFFNEFWSDFTQAFSRTRTSLSFIHPRVEDSVIVFLDTLVNTATFKIEHLLDTRDRKYTTSLNTKKRKR
jgi:hypothetical protein